MPIKHDEVLLELDDNEVIWRYIAKWKFESILKNEALFFSRTDKFSDPFEGSIPKKEEKHRISEVYRSKSKNPKETIEHISRN